MDCSAFYKLTTVIFVILKSAQHFTMPSKKFLYFIVPVAVVIPLLALLYTLPKEDPFESRRSVDLSVLNIVDEVDSDGDGLMDWEEVLWGLDPNNPQSNPQGISDGEYIENLAQNNQQAPGTRGNELFSDRTGNTTDDLGRDLFAEYLSLKREGSVNPFMINQVADRLSAEYVPQVSISQVSPEELRVVEDSDVVLRSFGNSVASIKNKYTNIYLENPFTQDDFGGASLGPDSKAKMLYISDLYAGMAQEMRALAVPRSFTQTHAQLISSYIISSEGFREFALLEENPIEAMFGIQKHSEAVDLEEDALINMQLLFQANGILFTSSESGSYWNI